MGGELQGRTSESTFSENSKSQLWAVTGTDSTCALASGGFVFYLTGSLPAFLSFDDSHKTAPTNTTAVVGFYLLPGIPALVSSAAGGTLHGYVTGAGTPASILISEVV